MKKNNDLKIIIAVFALLSIIMLVQNSSYALFQWNVAVDEPIIIINTSDGDFCFNIDSNIEILTKNSQTVTITISNYNENTITPDDIKYTIELDNSNFDLSVSDNDLERTIKGAKKIDDTFELTITPNKEITNDNEIVVIKFKIAAPYESEKELILQYSTAELKMDIIPNDTIIRVANGNTNYNNVIRNSIKVVDNNNAIINADVSYQLSSNFDVNKIGVYDVTYTAVKDGYANVVKTFKLAVCEPPPNIDFIDTFSYLTYHTQVNSQGLSIVNVTSNGIDPQIIIPFSKEYYAVDTSQYRYAVVRYRSSSTQDDLMGIYATEQPMDQQYFVYLRSIKTDGVWHEAVLDLWSNEAVKNKGWITGIRFDYTNNSNVNMDIDYIKFVKDLNIDYKFFEGFDTTSYVQYKYTNIGVTSVQDSIIKLQAMSSDPQIQMVLNENQYFDPKQYKFLYITFRINKVSDKMEFFMVPDPTSQVYSISQTVIGNGIFNTVVFDLSANVDVWNLEKITGWRLDPVATNGVIVEIDSIGVSDRCR